MKDTHCDNANMTKAKQALTSAEKTKNTRNETDSTKNKDSTTMVIQDKQVPEATKAKAP